MNHLYYGDNLEVLRKHIRDESVDLCYIDPPFNSKRNYNQIYNNVGKEDLAQAQAFVDTWTWDDLAVKGFREITENYYGKLNAQTINLIIGFDKVLGKGSLLAYLISIALRTVEIHRVLRITGTFYFHCDPTSSHYIKLILDSVFCPNGGNFLNEIIWCYRGGGSSKQDFGRRHDVIFRYSKSKDYNFYSDDIRIPYQAEGFNRKDDAMWGKHKGSNKVYKPNPLGKVPEDWWLLNPLNSNDPERLGYPTQKPEILLERIIKASSNEGDTVLDAYCGCGTSVAVAQKLNRKWVGIDITYQSISLILKRIEDAHGVQTLDAINLSGIPKDMASAKSLANKKDDRVRKEFEKWAVLTYSKNQAAINQKKGADQGIDGLGFFPITDKDFGRIIFQVKSGKVTSKDIRDLLGTITRENAELGFFITLQPPSRDMVKEAKACSSYHHKLMNKDIPKLQIVTIQEILEQGKRLDLSLVAGVLKSSPRHVDGEQLDLMVG